MNLLAIKWSGSLLLRHTRLFTGNNEEGTLPHHQ